MCGIAGFVSSDFDVDRSAKLIGRMAHSLNHRGPDYVGTLVKAPVALGHARLSIIDLRPEANQPMQTIDGDVSLVFNGEIYNFLDLGRELEAKGVTLHTRSDTEVVLRCYEQYGLSFVTKLRGMFAIAIWDRRRRRLVLTRDRLGQKPLFYYQKEERVAFASELRTLLLDESIPRNVDDEAMRLYLSLGFVPSSHAIIRGVRKVPPASVVVWENDALRTESYWKLTYQPRSRPTRQLVSQLYDELDEAVSLRMISDVPLGAFLSGGIDSSTICGLWH